VVAKEDEDNDLEESSEGMDPKEQVALAEGDPRVVQNDEEASG
jgi:hypothetical protein